MVSQLYSFDEIPALFSLILLLADKERDDTSG
jgi:hypothetical protein